ncbi:hypothetical protein [Streptomyces sp. NPDC096132]|uniref:hypothetical protein n=1 Tax=Streptomyces sp. NPDC096132 TaxID=3366075 RepID=UPI00380A079C
MGIDLQLHKDRPHWPTRRSKREPTLIRASHEHAEALAELLARLPAPASGRLGTVDPYDDTVFNEQVAEAALAEIPGLLTHCTGPAHTAAAHDLATFLTACATTPGSHLVFVGD